MLDQLPDSPAQKLHLVDYIKGFGLSLLVLITLILPDIEKAVNGHDFGDYNKPIQLIVFLVAWFLQRWAKNNIKDSPV